MKPRRYTQNMEGSLDELPNAEKTMQKTQRSDKDILMDFFESITTCAYGKLMFGHNDDGTLYIQSTGESVSLEDAVTYMKMFVCTMLGFI